MTTLSLTLLLLQPASPKTEFDVAYVQRANEKQKLDLFLPAGFKFPTIVFVHGGAWVMGDRKQAAYQNFGKMLQGQGIACAVISYRLSPTVQHPAHTEDGAAAFAWIKQNIEARGGDPSKVFLLGHSAGGHIVALLATDPKYLAKHDLKTSDISGCMPMGAVLDVRALGTLARGDLIFKSDDKTLEDASPITHLRREVPRMLILVAQSDFPALKAQAQRFYDKAKQISAPVSFFEMPDRDHITTISKLLDPNDVAVKKILEFVRQ